MTKEEIKKLIDDMFGYHLDEFGLEKEESVQVVAESIAYMYFKGEILEEDLKLAKKVFDEYGFIVSFDGINETKEEYKNYKANLDELLNRFKKAQDSGVYENALNEIKNEKKESCWMWFIFPQVKGLGKSYNSKYYSLRNYDDAVHYYEDDVLGKRLLEVTHAVLDLKERDIIKVFGYHDSIKLKSCMTLFFESTQDDLFKDVLNKYFDGKKDDKTLEILEKAEEDMECWAL